MTTAETLLMRGLKLSKMQNGNILLCMMLMGTEEKRWDLITYLASILLAENPPEVSEEEIVQEAYRIAAM